MTSVHLAILLISLSGFFSLALATERYSEHLLRRVPAPQWRHLARAAGWGLLALSLGLGIAYMDVGVGITLWLGWLTVAALALVFAFPKWPWQPAERAKPARKPKAGAKVEEEPAPLPMSARRRWAVLALLVAVPLVYLVGLSATPVKPLLRDDAVSGEVGPWSFRLAESDQRSPEVVAMGIPMKSYHLRFCAECDEQIRAAYMKVNKPRSLRAPGIVLQGARWDRSVLIQLPANTTADSELWLTVVGKNGETHQTAVRMGDVSPGVVAWFAAREGK